MPSEDNEKKGAPAPDSEALQPDTPPTATVPEGSASPSVDTYEDPYTNYDQPYGYDPHSQFPDNGITTEPQVPAPVAVAPPAPPKPPVTEEEEEDEDDDGMLRMSFMDHLEELRARLIRMLAGLAVVFVGCLAFAERLWFAIQEPAAVALKQLGYTQTSLVATTPMETFSIVWVKLPMLAAVFLASPWLLYQVWSFIAPGLYKRERRFAAPFVICSAGLFVLGGVFAYFVAFRFGLSFLLGIGKDINIIPMITISEYFDMFCNVMLGIGLVFELPILIFFLVLLRIASPSFLISNSRYAILIIVVIAAVITPTPDVYNLTIFSVPMVVLYFVGIFAGYILTLNRENKRFPWRMFLLSVGIPLVLILAGSYLALSKYGYKLVLSWPFLVR